MMLVERNGKLYSAPWGSEYLGLGEDGTPVAFWRAGWVAPMVLVGAARSPGKDPA